MIGEAMTFVLRAGAAFLGLMVLIGGGFLVLVTAINRVTPAAMATTCLIWGLALALATTANWRLWIEKPPRV